MRPPPLLVPYRVLHSRAPALACIELHGVVRWTDVASALEALYAPPTWVPGTSVLWNARAVTSFDIPPSDLPAIRAFMAKTAAARAGGRSAVLVRDDLDAMLALLLARMGPRTGRVVEVVFRLEDALAFLELRDLPREIAVVASSPPEA